MHEKAVNPASDYPVIPFSNHRLKEALYENKFSAADDDVCRNIELRFGGIYREREITFKMPLEAFRLGVPNPPVRMMQR